ncbi:serine/threonine-protein kinase [Bounagaea algeriensis]
MSDAGGLLADRYRLQRRLGSGAMGVVWLATDERLQRPVAVKQLAPQHRADAAQSDEAQQRAMREGRIAGRLHHPNVVAVHDVTEHEGLPVLVMEYVPARSLADVLIERGTLAPAEAAAIGGQAAEALVAAHEAGIVHRDVKPGNVLITEDETVKITDFGIAHAAGDITVTQTGLLNGTPAFLAPEIARGNPPAPASDVFSLGATLYAAVEGHPPFGQGTDNALAVLHEAAAGDIPPPQCAGPLAPVLAQAMAADPTARLGPQQLGTKLRTVTSDRSAAATQPIGDAPTQPMSAVVASAGTRGGTRVAAGLAPWSGQDTGTASRRRRPLLLTTILTAVLLVGLSTIPLLTTGEDAPPARAKPAVTPGELERVVSDYYALLPGHPGNAWSRLGPRMRAQGQQQYHNTWRQVSDLTVTAPPRAGSEPRADSEKTVRVSIELTHPDGATVRERHTLGMTTRNGVPLINSDTVLHADTSTPPPPPPPEPAEEEASKSEGEGSNNEEENKKEKNKKEENDKKEEDDDGDKREKHKKDEEN